MIDELVNESNRRLAQSTKVGDVTHRFLELWAAAVLAGRSIEPPTGGDRDLVAAFFAHREAAYVEALCTHLRDVRWLARRRDGAVAEPVGMGRPDTARQRRIDWSRAWLSGDSEARRASHGGFAEVLYVIRNNVMHIQKRLGDRSDEELLRRASNLLQAILESARTST